ncbi:MAG: radical SAM family heme chaperone HemW, partial [Desulfosarcina sp.]
MTTDASCGTPFGIYIHVPFCRSKCAYCDFYSITQLDLIDAYIEALMSELARCQDRHLPVDTVYLGGGTPSLLTPRQLAQVLNGVQTCFSVAADAEVTLEVNPGTVNRRKLADFLQAGLNRLTIGLQSIDKRTLAFLGRIHDAKEGVATYEWARKAGFDNVGLDLIYGIPGQTPRRWQAEMASVVRLAPEHLSCYTLTVEPNTPMARQVQAGQILPPDERTIGDLFLRTGRFLNDNGYRQYEVSNFARHAAGDRRDWRSQHNRKYWNAAPYLGFGPAAHSFKPFTRWWNQRTLDRYLAAIGQDQPVVAGREVLTREQQIMEVIYLGLRQTEGIDTAAFASMFEADFSERFEPQLSRLTSEGMI